MAVTKEQALIESNFHRGTCAKNVGPRGGESFVVERWRRNGSTQTWKTRPDEFRVPVKFGMRRYGNITQYNADEFHVASECPIQEMRGW